MKTDSEELLTGSQLLLYTECYNQNKKSLGLAVLLCLFGGGIGLHRFYLKQSTAGVFYLLFCWTLIPAMLSVLDLVLLQFTVNRYNRIIAVNVLSTIQPNASCALIDIHQKNDKKNLRWIIRALGSAMVIIFPITIYNKLINDSFWESNTNKTEYLIDKIDSVIHNQYHYKQQPYYALKYDGLSLGMSLRQAMELGYDKCDSNKFYTICSNSKNAYPTFYTSTVRYVIVKFNQQQQLIMIHVYPQILPDYTTLSKKLPTAAHGNRKNTEYMELAGSNEEIFINQNESSIDIYDNQVIVDYDKHSSQQKLLIQN